MTLDINIKSAEDAEKLSAVACKTPDVLWAHSTDGMIMVDCRSLLGLFTLIGKPCHLVAEDTTSPKTLTKVARRAGVAIN